MTAKLLNRQRLFSDTAVIIYLSLFSLFLHFIVNASGAYGYFRDELYYIACSHRLDWGYVDHPPLSILLLALNRTLFGHSLFALRLLPALAGAATVYLCGLLARQLGGNRFAQALAATAAIIAPVYLSIFNFYSMNSFDILSWTLCFYIIVKIISSENFNLWLPFGLVVGLGLQNKISIGFLCLGIAVGLLLTQCRHYFLSKRLWLGGLLAALIFLPHILWQIHHGWPTLEFMRNAQLYKNAPVSFFGFLGGQIMMMHPFNLLIWLPGLLYLFFSREGKCFRVLGIAFVAILVLFVLQRGKAYYLSPFYPILFAAGGTALENFISRRNLSWLKPTLLSLLVVGGIITAPMALPVLPEESFIRYADTLGVRPGAEERHRLGKLPQHYADMHGWENMAAVVAEVYRSLPPEEQAECAVFTRNYGEAGAIDFFGKAYRLPDALSGHNNYWLWGPREFTGEIVIIIGGHPDDYRDTFRECRRAAVITNRYAMPYENNLPVYLCRGIKIPLEELWPRLKHFQ